MTRSETATAIEPVLRRDAAENRRKLLDAARLVFDQHGTEAGVEEVAHAAGVGIGTLYRRFPTKDALIAELVREMLVDTRRLALTSMDDPDGNGLERFLYAVAAIQAGNRGCVARLWATDTTELRSECRGLIARLLADGQAAGRIRPDATLTDVDLLFWSLRGILEATADHDPSAWRRHIALVVAGLRPSPEPLGEPPVTPAASASVRADIGTTPEHD